MGPLDAIQRVRLERHITVVLVVAFALLATLVHGISAIRAADTPAEQPPVHEERIE